MDKSNKHSKDPPKNINNMVCEICGDVGVQRVSICCRCKITREHPYCMKIMHADNPKDWVCEECELKDQRRACSSKPGISKLGDHARACSSKPGISELRDQTRACSSKPGPSKEPNNTAIRGNIQKPPRNSKVQYLPPEDTPKKDVYSRSTLNLSCRPTVNRTPPPKSEAIKCSTVIRPSPLKLDAIRCSTMNRTTPSFCVTPNSPGKPSSTVKRTPLKPGAIRCSTMYRTPPKFCVTPNTPDKPPVIKLQSPISRPNTQQNKKLSGFKDTEKYVVKKQHVRQDSPLAIRSAKEAQTSNATAEERRAAQPFWQKASTSKSTPGKSMIQELGTLLYQAYFNGDEERDNTNPGQISRRLVQDLRPVRSDKGPARQLYRDNFAGMPVPCEKVQCNTERVIKNAGHASMQSVHHSLATSSGKESSEFALELDKYLPNHPAEVPTWKGRFNIRHADAVSLYRSIDGIQARPPCKMYRKAYDLSLKLPKALEFELLPRLNIWGNLFDYSVPDTRDIGLYFLSSKITTLLDYMYEHDMLLRSQIDGVELLVFPSQHLAECSQTIDNKYFLWGLFRPLEDNIEALGGESSEHMDISLSGGYEESITEQLTPKLPKDSNADSTVQTVPKSRNDANPEPKVQKFSRAVNPNPTVQAVPKRADSTVQKVPKSPRYANLVSTVQTIQKPSRDVNPDPTVQAVSKRAWNANRGPTVQTIQKPFRDVNPDPTVQAVPKRARNANRGPTVQAVQKSAKDANPDTTMLQAVPKPAKDANPGPTADKLTPVKQENPDWSNPDQPLATSYLQDESEFERDLQRSFDRFMMLGQPGQVEVKEEGGSPGR